MVNPGFRTNEPDVIYQLFDEEVVVIDVPTGTYHSLNGVAGDIFLALGSGGATAHQIASQLTSKYDAPSDTIHRDVVAFLGHLADQTLIVPIEVAAAGSPETSGASDVQRLPYVAPSLQTYNDLQELLLLDPVHDVSAAGWPNLPAEEVTTAAEAFRCRPGGPHVIFEKFDDETVAMNVSTGAYYTLYGPAEDIFLLIPEDPTLEEIQRALGAKYVMDSADLDGLVRDFVRNLATAGLVLLEAVPPDADSSAARELILHRPGSGLPFSTLSLQVFDEPQKVVSTSTEEGLPSGQRRYRIGTAGLLRATAGGEMVAIDRDLGVYYRLNEAAADAFRLLESETSLEELAGALSQKYDVTERELAAALMVFIWHLLRMKLVTAVPAEKEQPAPALDGPIPAKRVPFKGFDITLHKDLMDLMRPMNAVAQTTAKPPAGRSAQFRSMLHQYFSEAAARLGATDSCFEMGGTKVLVRRAGNNEAELETACSHLAASAGTAAGLTIHVWDCAVPATDYFLTLALEKLHANWSAACGPRGEFLDFHSEGIPVIYHPGPDILSVLDVEQGQAYFLKRDASPLPYWEIGSPFRYILHSWFAVHGLQFVHGGAVGTPKGGVLLVGKGGSGKSTTSMLCVKAGLLYAGDDYCLADPNTGFLFSLYNTGKLKGNDDLQRLPEMAGRSRNRDGFEHGGVGKGIFFVSDIWPERVTSGFPLRAVLIPQVSGERDSRIEPASPGQALLAMLPSTVAQLPAANQSDCERLAQLAAALPAYTLHLGTDLEQIPALIRGVLD